MENPFTAWRSLLDRHPFAKDVVWGAFEFALTFLIFYWFTLAIHEWCHLSVLRYFGGDGYIIRTWFGAGIVFTSQPLYPQLVAFAGGIGIAIFYTFLCFMDWDDDIESAAALIPLICSQLAYGIVEGFFIFNVSAKTFSRYASQALTVGWVVGLILSIIVIVEWLVKLNAKYSKK